MTQDPKIAERQLPDDARILTEGASPVHGLKGIPSPEPNPEEPLNADLKHVIGTRVPERTKTRLKLGATEHMVKLEPSPERVNSFFQDPRVKYAA